MMNNNNNNVYFYAFINPGHPGFIKPKSSTFVQPYFKLINRMYPELFASDDSNPSAYIDGTSIYIKG